MVLAGGASRRLGGALKGLELVGGRRIIDRVVDALRPVTTEVVLAANDASSANWLPGVVVLHDRIRDAGGLAGVEAALARGTDALVVAWDMPFVPVAVLEDIVATANADDADVVVPESNSPFGFEPFCAYYAARVAAELTAFLTSGSRAPRDFLARLKRARRVPRQRIERIGDPGRLFLSVNSPQDLAAARAAADSAQ